MNCYLTFEEILLKCNFTRASTWQLFSMFSDTLAVFLFHLESHILCGFGVINFICLKNMRATAGNVCDFKFEGKAVTIFRGAGVEETLNHSEWKENSQNYVRKFYTKRGRFVEAILIPDFTKKEKPHGIVWNNVIDLEIMRKWCSNLGLIIPNYNVVDHFNFYGISKSYLEKVLDIKSMHENNNRRLLIFNASCKVLVTIRMALETQLKEEINQCIIDINMLILMFRDELKGSGVVVTGLVVYLGKNLHLESNCNNCQHLIVTRKEFESEESINNFWKEYKEKPIFKKIKTRLPDGDERKEFMTVSSKILPYLASYQYQVCSTQVLPTLEKDATENVFQAELLLDRYQMEIAHSMENRIILKGDYGTGKTIICLKKIEILSAKLKDREAIYYINFQGKSELDGVVSKKIKQLHQNINVLKGDSTLSNIIESKILSREEKIGTQMVHLFVDEYNTESLTKEEVSTVVEIFSEKELLKNSKIFIAIQPIEMKRKNFHYINGEESEYCENGNMLRDLEKIMTVQRLQHVMRTTVEINSLIEITQEYLNEKSNQYTRNVESSEQMLGDEVSQSRNLNIHENLLKDASGTIDLSDEVNHHDDHSHPQDEFFTRESKSQILIFEHNSTISENIQIDLTRKASISNSNVKRFQYEKIIDFDELHKLTSTEDLDSSENCQKRETTYRYHFQSSIGHNISGPPTNLIDLTCFNQNEVFEVFASVFQLIESKNKRTVVIHFEKDNPSWLINLFNLSIVFPSLAVVDNVEEFSSKINERVVLVKNYNCVRGIEFSDVIVLLDANEYHLKQFIPEAMARCQSNLSIVIKPAENGKGREDAVMDLIEYWKRVNLEEEEEKLIRILHLHFCECTSTVMCSRKAGDENLYCRKAREENKTICYEIHKNSKSYKNMSEKIRQKIASDVSSNQLGKREALTL